MASLLPPTEASVPALQEKLRALRDAASYPEPVGDIETIETHCAWVFLTDTHAYKLKKPIRLDRMDHLLLSSRHHSCLEELRLNRRLAPDVYLDVVSLNVNESRVLRIGGDGVPVEWLVKMRRLPSELMLDHAIAAGTVTASALRAVAELLAEFYVGQTSVNISANAYLERMARQIEGNQAALLAADLGLSAEIVNAIVSRQQEFLQRRSSLFIERAQLGKIVEAHGDLKPEHVYLGTPPCVIDCLEFDRDLRLLDSVEELAFLSLECQRLGEPWIGREFTRIYAAVSGDRFEQSLFDFYLSRRATQRAVTAAWHLRDHALKCSTDWRARATAYLNDALRILYGLGIGGETAKL